MTLAQSVSEALRRDALAEALDAVLAGVKRAPSETSARYLLIDLLVLDGDYERADKHCAIASTVAPDAAAGLARLRAELRGMAARTAFFEASAVPDIPGGPAVTDEHALRLSLAHRAGERHRAQRELSLLDEARGVSALSVNGVPSADVRDADDRIPHALEAITPGGAYLWLKFSDIARLRLDPMTRPRHLAFRTGEIRLRDGSTSPVTLPAIYHGSGLTDRLKLGRETLWEEAPSGITVGRGQRCLLAGDDLVSLHDIATLEAPGSSTEATASEVLDG